MPWPEVGYKFGGDSSENPRGGDSRNSCKPDATYGVVQLQTSKGKEIDISSDNRECAGRRDAFDRPSVVRGEESMVAVHGGCVNDGGGTTNDLGTTATDFGSTCVVRSESCRMSLRVTNTGESTNLHFPHGEQEYHETNSSLLAKCDIQSACNVSRDGDGSASANITLIPREGQSLDMLKQIGWNLRGGGEIDAFC